MSVFLAPAATSASMQRYSCEVQTTCQPPSACNKDPWPAVIREIWTRGVSLRLGRRFERDNGLAIELPAEYGVSTTVLARITRVEPTQGGWLLTCTFISELSDDEVRSVLDLDPLHRTVPVSPETGQNLVKTGSINGVVFQTSVAGEILRWFVRRLDLSSGWPLPRGLVVQFRVGGISEAPVALTIKQCRQAGSYWIVDCTFTDEPSGEILRVLMGGK